LSFLLLEKIIQNWQGFRAFNKVPRKERNIVFYSEGGEYNSFFEPIIKALWVNHNQLIQYVTSSPTDPYLSTPPLGVKPFLIGKGTLRTAFFSFLDADVLVMTMPDLDTFHIKRSKNNVHYVYVPHSIVSTHMIYREAAFDNFDTVFCAGVHHMIEIQNREQQNNLKSKNLIAAGYCRLDTIINAVEHNVQILKEEKPQATVLIAPSWGPGGLIEKYGITLLEILIDSGFKIILRPHPRTIKTHSHILRHIHSVCGDNENFKIDTDTNSIDSFLKADIMISDWSGAAFEFSLGVLRPVLFIDVDRKINNPNYEKLDMAPIEVVGRERVGEILSVDNLNLAGKYVKKLIKEAPNWEYALLKARDDFVFNIGKSGRIGAQGIVDVLLEASETNI
jgi:hypothetical protein